MNIENHMVLNTADAPWNAPDADPREEREQVVSHLTDELRWKGVKNYGGQMEYSSPDNDLQLKFWNNYDSGWELGSFTDGDINGVATGRYETFAEGSDVGELREAIRLHAIGVKESAEQDVAESEERAPDDRAESAFVQALREAVANA